MAADSSERYVLLNQLADEFAERYRRGEHPSLQDYVDQHPDLGDDIREYFPALIEVEQVKEDRRDIQEPTTTGLLPPLAQLGDYRVLREIGHGGMGVVYEAEQISLGRHVALKVLPKPLLADARTKERFEREAKAAAKLHHSNIVPVYGVGEEGGLRYYAMQFIQGLGLDEVLEELKQVQRSRPGGPSRGEPDVVGFGRLTGGERRVSQKNGCAGDMARSLLTGRLTAEQEDLPAVESGATIDHAPRAAADEAPLAETPIAGRLSDTFSLSSSSVVLPGVGAARRSGKKRPTYWQSVARIGVQAAEALDHAHKLGVLHRDVKPSNLLLDTRGTVWVTDFGLAKMEELPNLTLTGDILGTLRYMPPEAFDGRADERSDVYSLGLTLYELLALRPAFEERERNRLIKQVTTSEPPRLEKLNREVPRELVTIVHKAIDHEPARRYATAAALAEDLERFLADEPIRARRVGSAERLWRWCRRNPVVARLTAALLLVFLVGFAGVAWKWREAERQKDISAEQREIAVEQADRSRRLLYASDMSLAQQTWDAGDTGRARALLERQGPQDGQEDLRGFEWRYLWGLCRDRSRQTLRRHTDGISSIAFSPDGQILATSGDHSVQLWNVATQRRVRLIGGLWVGSLAFAPGGKTLAMLDSGAIRLWDVAGRCERARLQTPTWAVVMALSHDNLLAVGDNDGTIRIWDVATLREVGSPLAAHTGRVQQVAFSSDGRTLASGGADGKVRLWDVASWRLTATLQAHTAFIHSLCFSPDGKLLASASNDTTVRLWDTATKLEVKKLWSQRTALTLVACYTPLGSLAFSPDSKLLATGGGDGTVRLWDVETKEVVSLLRGHTAAVRAVAFAPDGRSLASGSQDGAVKVWDVVRGPDPNILTGHKSNLSSLAFSQDGKTLAVADSLDQTVKLWDLASRKVAVLEGHKAHLWTLTFAPGGQTIASTSKDGTIRLWDVASKKQLEELQLPDGDDAGSVAFSPDGKLLAAGCWGSDTVRVWDLVSKRQLKHLVESALGYSVQFSPDGTLLAAISGKTVQLWDVATWQKAGALSGHMAELHSLAFAPDGRSLAVGDSDGTVCLWDVAQKRQIASRGGHTSSVESMAFSPDGGRLASSGADGTVRLWEVALLQEVATLTGHEGPVNCVAFSPDGNTLATGSADRTVRLWHAPPLPAVLRDPAEAPSMAPDETIRPFALEQNGTARGRLVSKGNVEQVDVTAADGAIPHAVQLCQLFDELQEGETYTIRFRAKADAPRRMKLWGEIAGPDWHCIGLDKEVPLTEDWKPYQYQFQAKDLTAWTKINFRVGDRTGTVWIADVALIKGTK